MRVLFACTQGAGHLQPGLPFVDACRRAGHEVLVVGPPPLAATLERLGLPYRVGASPDPAELGAVWGRVPTASEEEAQRLVVGEIFARLNAEAMLPPMREILADWRPDVVLREHAEHASAQAADETGIPHVQIGIGLLSAHVSLGRLSAEYVERRAPGLSERVAATPYLTLFPASFDPAPPEVTGPVHRFRDPAADAPPAPLEDLWPGDDRPFVYVTFGSVTGTMPPAAPIFRVACEAVADLPARVLMTTGVDPAELGLEPPGPHVAIRSWVPQAEVLPHAHAVVCHGGSGTTLGALAAGVPLVITPLFADQGMNARRVEETGAGLAVEPRGEGAVRSDVDPVALREAILAVLEEDGPRRVAAAIREEVRGLPATDEAVALLEAVAAGRAPGPAPLT
jgi:UDP:flavonoid glycosyltransferase YjiC (YdhE family)